MAAELKWSIRAKKDRVGLSAFTRKSETPQRQWDEGLDRASRSQSGSAVWKLVHAGTQAWIHSCVTLMLLAA